MSTSISGAGADTSRNQLRSGLIESLNCLYQQKGEQTMKVKTNVKAGGGLLDLDVDVDIDLGCGCRHK
jgi:hypothetical protein